MPQSDDWVSDDPSVVDDEVVYRRVLKGQPGSFDVTVDRVSGTACLGKGAFSLNSRDKEPPAGGSVHLEGHMRSHEIPTSALATWDTHGVGRFYAKDVRRGPGGVVAWRDPDDAALGEAHALLRTPSAGLPKPEWSDIRSAILESAVYFESDPGYAPDL